MGNGHKKLISITGSSALYSAVNHAQKTLVPCGMQVTDGFGVMVVVIIFKGCLCENHLDIL